MTVSEFITIWNKFFKNNMPIKYTLNNKNITLYDLLKVNTILKEFKLEFKLNPGMSEYNIYSDVYDLSEVSWDVKKVINSLQVETYDNIYNNELIIHLKGGE